MGELLHCHLASTAAIPSQRRIGKIGGVEQPGIQYVNVQVDQDMVETPQEGLNLQLYEKYAVCSEGHP